LRSGLGLLGLVQAGVFALGVWILAPRWMPAAAIAGVCAAAQLIGAVGWFTVRLRLAQWMALVSLSGGLVLIGLYVQAAAHILSSFGADARNAGMESIGGVLVAVPWALAVPAAQAIAAFRWRTLPSAALALLVPIAAGAIANRPLRVWDPDPPVAEALRGADARWRGDAGAAIPSGAGPARVLLTVWSGGKPLATERGEGTDLAAAIGAALAKLAPPDGSDQALVLDVALLTRRPGSVARAGASGRFTKNGGISPSVAWRPSGIRQVEKLPGWRVPMLKAEGAPVEFRSAVAAGGAVTLVEDGWAATPELTAENVLDATLAAGRMIVHNQEEDGRYAYRVDGPSGEVEKGYNYPRHAGATWFLARLAQRTGDPEITAGAQRGLQYMAERSETLADGRLAVKDPSRNDGKIWVGTTALATMAAVAAGDRAHAESWGAFVASSVDERGAVRGELDVKSETFPEQPLNSYGQGQVALALAQLVRAGHPNARDAARRAFAYIDGGYAPGAAGRLLSLDEHWLCLAALAGRDLTTEAPGLCRAYIENSGMGRRPDPGSTLLPASGPAGGFAEAVVASAYLFPNGPYRDLALRYGWLFLRSSYKVADSPFLGRPDSLLGGFRDSLAELDVQVDSVQHIGCALLGIESLLTGDAAPGSLP
jgi:hypothetical protein